MTLFIMTKNLYNLIYIAMASKQKNDEIISQQDETIQQVKMNEVDNKLQEYLSALNEYYKLKDEYEGENSDFYKKKIKIRKDTTLSKSEKYKEWQRAKENRKCVNCKQKGGTFFAIDQAVQAGFIGQNSLIARCNATDNKCDLNIEITPKRVKYINEIEGNIIKNIKNTKKKIISSKLSLLFDLQTEDVVLKQFDDLKEDLGKFNDQMNIVQERLGENNSIKILDPTSGEPKIILKKDFLKSKNRKLNEAIYEFKNRMLKIDDTNDKTIRNAFDTYIDISNTLGSINDVTYKEYFVDYDIDGPDGPSYQNPYYIIKNENNIQQMEIVSGEYSIVKNEK